MAESAVDVIQIDDDDDWVEADVPLIEPAMTIEAEREDIPVELEQEQ